MFHINGRKRGNLHCLCNCMKQNVVFLDKMFHIKGARWRLVPYVILEGHSPDRIQTSIKKRTAAMLPFLRMVGWEASPSLQSRPRPHCHAGLCSGISIIPPKPGLPLPLLAGAHSPHPQRPAFDKVILYLQTNRTAIFL